VCVCVCVCVCAASVAPLYCRRTLSTVSAYLCCSVFVAWIILLKMHLTIQFRVSIIWTCYIFALFSLSSPALRADLSHHAGAALLFFGFLFCTFSFQSNALIWWRWSCSKKANCISSLVPTLWHTHAMHTHASTRVASFMCFTDSSISFLSVIFAHSWPWSWSFMCRCDGIEYPCGRTGSAIKEPQINTRTLRRESLKLIP
jgi:hypothetical protein